MPTDEETQREVLKSVARALQLVYELVPISLNQRPAFPAIDVPAAGSVIAALQTAPTALPVSVSSNRGDLVHYVDLLDADTFAVLDGDKVVAFAGNTGSANILIPAQGGPGPTTCILQCRCPTSVAGNSHRIFIDLQAPALPAPPTVTLSAVTGAGMPLPSGSYPHTTAGLDAVVVTATVTGVTGAPTFNWSLTEMGPPPIMTASLANTFPANLIPVGILYPTSAVISCFVTTPSGLFSAPVMLSYIIT